MEALAAGVPVLSSDVGIAREAGAIVVARPAYIQKAVGLLEEGLPRRALLGTSPLNTRSHPVLEPYPSFDAYVAAYAEDLRATCAD
jgi:hypothetical protein